MSDMKIEDSGDSGDLIRGDRFTGLSISGMDNHVYQFKLDGQAVTVNQVWQRRSANQAVLALGFAMAAPVRFRVDVLVPDDCRNACATLNNQLLISWFADDIPGDLPEIISSACQEDGKPISTLRPGHFQSVNFRWFDQDILRFYFIW